jgi:ATP-dependent RNA helicase DDX10/DBP4
MKSIYLQKDKTTFDLSQYPAEEFAASMGLPGAPQISFGNQKVKEKKRGGEEAVMPAVEEEVGRDVVASDDDSDAEEDEDDEDEVSDSAGEGGLEIGSGSEDEDEDEDAPTVSPSSTSPGRGADFQSKAPAVRTKYDRMFERKNQSILAPHYSALISHGDEAEEGDDDVFTLARRDHDIEANENDDLLQETTTPADDTPLITSEDLSKRKLKAATSKKALLKSRPAPEKVIFDEVTGEPRNFYESGADLETLAGGDAERKKFLEEEGKRMREAHRIDKEVAKEKKREKKRKRQERARGSDDEDEGDGSEDGLAIIGDGEVGDDDDDFINGLVGMLSDREEEEEDRPKGKKSKSSSKSKKVDDGLEDEEALALRLLQGS